MINDDSREVFLKLFGDNVKKYRKSKKISYRKLAQHCDLDFSYISKIEKGEVNVTLETILELMKGLDLPAKEFFDFDFDLDRLNVVK
ncbi:transcriptional regulator [Flavobacterium sp. IR1]|nr:transcriptional regulator [Flavobacterium sp. IR1]